MIVVNAIVEASEEDITALQGAIAEMEAASRAEQGCLDYTFSVELNRPHVVRITEKWQSLEALKEHFRAAPYDQVSRCDGRSSVPPGAGELL